MIDVALTPEQLRPSDIAVVVDVLRATSMATQALAAGYRRVLFADSVERATALRAPGRVLAGERNCVAPPGFDLGNSPRAVIDAVGDELVLATTNGTPTVVAAARHARVVILACMLNLGSVIEALRGPHGAPEGDIQLVCSATNGAVALEDAYVAGRLCAELDGQRSDAARVVEAVAHAYRTSFDAFRASAHAVVLDAAGLDEDIVDCARESTIDVVPRVQTANGGVAIVVPAGATRSLDPMAAEARATVTS